MKVLVTLIANSAAAKLVGEEDEAWTHFREWIKTGSFGARWVANHNDAG